MIMTDKKTDIVKILDELALKIVMVEPGDLSVVGELLELVEKINSLIDSGEQPLLVGMMATIHDLLEKIIMGELEDDGKSYEGLGQGVSLCQQAVRSGGDEEIADKFSRILESLGCDPGFTVSSPDSGEEQKEKEGGSGGEDFSFLQDLDLLGSFIGEAFEHLETIEVNVLELEQHPGDLDLINNIFRPFHTIKGVSGFLNLKTVNVLAHSTENLLDDVRNGELAMNRGVIDVVLAVGDYLRTMIQNVSEVMAKGVEAHQEFDISDFLARIKGVREGGPSSGADEDQGRVVEVEEAAAVKVASVSGGQQLAIEPTIKVRVDKLDNLVNAVGELVIMQAMVRQNPMVLSLSDPKLNKDFSQLTRITTDLQKTAMTMRMVPIRQTFQKMTRLVRDLSRKTGKKVNLVMKGEETEIDRNMVDSIYDPLLHMIRNSIDHGVQLPAEREKAGKSETGTVLLSAYQKGGNIVIEIKDDGQGVNTTRIRDKALERGLITVEDSLGEQEINNLIFLPGFSTAEEVTDVSGRGVGMDVVKKGVDKLQGKVDLYSVPGEGCQFLMRLPLTLAIIDGIVVRVGSERYIIPTIAIRESMRPQPDQYKTVQDRGETLLVRDRLIPLVRLGRVFGVSARFEEVHEGIVVIIENEGALRALLVDELLGKQEVVIKSIGEYLKGVQGLAGGTILADGRVGLIIDVAGLFMVSEQGSLE